MVQCRIDMVGTGVDRYTQMESAAQEASALLRAMSNERRLVILCHLAKGEHSVGRLCELIGMSQSALSQHLAKLRHDDLVTTRREAQTIYYALNGEAVTRVLDTLHDLYCPEDTLDREPAPAAAPPCSTG